MEDVIDKLYDGYGEINPFNKKGPDQGKIWQEGNEYLKCVTTHLFRLLFVNPSRPHIINITTTNRREFPLLDYFNDCSIIIASQQQKKGPSRDPATAATGKGNEKAGAAGAAKAKAEDAKGKGEKGEGKEKGPRAARAVAQRINRGFHWIYVLLIIGSVMFFVAVTWLLNDKRMEEKGK